MPATEPTGYPKREPFFAHRFCRLLTKSAAAQELGPETCWMLTVISHQEDVKRYRGAVTFYNGQLMPLCGFDSENRLNRARQRAIDAGWLHYEPGLKRHPGRYWVILPLYLDDLPDTPCDETFPLQNGGANGEENGFPSILEVQSEGEAGGKRRDKRGEIGGPSTLSLNPYPLPEDKDKEECSEPAKAPDTLPAVLRFDCVRGKCWGLTQKQIDEWATAFPAVDVLAECRKALAWIEANPTKRKTANGMPRFLFNWLSRSQNQGGTTRSNGAPSRIGAGQRFDPNANKKDPDHGNF